MLSCAKTVAPIASLSTQRSTLAGSAWSLWTAVPPCSRRKQCCHVVQSLTLIIIAIRRIYSSKFASSSMAAKIKPTYAWSVSASKTYPKTTTKHRNSSASLARARYQTSRYSRAATGHSTSKNSTREFSNALLRCSTRRNLCTSATCPVALRPVTALSSSTTIRYIKQEC